MFKKMCVFIFSALIELIHHFKILQPF